MCSVCHVSCVCVCERERERDRDRDRETETKTERDRERQRQIQREYVCVCVCMCTHKYVNTPCWIFFVICIYLVLGMTIQHWINSKWFHLGTN